MKAKKKTERPIRLDFDTHARKIIEVYEISPDSSQVRTPEGWVSNYRDGVIIQRPIRDQTFNTAAHTEFAIRAEQALLKERKHKKTGGYMIAAAYPMAEWLKGE